jgi:predicted SnoaL-like aldol condensation-catalyzing enzyme
MATNANKAVVQAFTEAVWHKRDIDAIDRYFSDRYRDPEIAGPPRDGLKQFFAAYFTRRPDFRVTSEDYIGEGDRVVQYITGEFTNTEERLGPPGARMEMHEINIFTVEDGQIVGRTGIGRSTPRTS